MTELKTMKISIDNLHEVVKMFFDCKDDILEIVKDLSESPTIPQVKYSIKHNDQTFILRLEQTVLMSIEEASAITDAFNTPVRKIDIFFNNHSLGCIHLTADDVKEGLNAADQMFVIGFITSQITKVGFNQWYEPNIGTPGFGFNGISDYNMFIKNMLKRVGHDTQIGWDGKIYNFSIFSIEPFEVKVQQNFYCCEAGYLDEQYFLGSIRATVHAVFFELFRKKQLGSSTVVDINYVE